MRIRNPGFSTRLHRMWSDSNMSFHPPGLAATHLRNGGLHWITAKLPFTPEMSDPNYNESLMKVLLG